MGRTFIGCVGLMVLGGFIVQPADAKDRRSASSAERGTLSEMIVPREAHAKSARQDTSTGSMERASATAAVLDRGTSNRNSTPTAPLREQQSASSSALSLKFGAVTLQPAVGGIKGAKFSIGF